MNRISRTTPHVAVVGAGLGGLAAAATLAARGYRVTVLDKNASVGGKASEIREGGYRFDVGPTILTMPSVLRRIFGEAGRDLESAVPMVRLDPQWRCFFEDGTALDLQEDIAAMGEALDRYANAPGASRRYREFCDYAKRLSDISDRYFFWRSVGTMREALRGNGFKLSLLRDLIDLRLGSSVSSQIRSYAEDPRVAQMLDHFTQYVGSAPDASPAVLCGIAHMQIGEGIWYPRGGTRAVPLALAELASSLGAEIREGAEVDAIALDARGSAKAVRLTSGERIACDAVVSNSDSVRTYRELINGQIKRGSFKGETYEPACSGVVLYLGLRKRYDHLLHHNFVFSRDPHAEFDQIYRGGEPADDPTCYVCAPSQTEPDVAPPGGEALYILVHTPYLRDRHDWAKMLPGYRQAILDKLKRVAGMGDLEDRIAVEHAMTPRDIHEKFRVLNGAIYGLASHGKFAGAFKPANRSALVPGLYLAGGSAHPGPGMPMALMSGWIAADSLDADMGAALGAGKAEAPEPALAAAH